MRTVILNNNNVVQDGKNNTLIYNFPTTAIFDKSYIAVASVSMYYSWFNISAALGNNTFSYSYPIAAGTQTVTVTIPDGLYEIATLNQLLQYTMIANGHYLINSALQNIYFVELSINEPQYRVQVTVFAVPTALPATYTQPTNYAQSVGTYPAVRTTPSITIPAALGLIIGYTALTTWGPFNNASVPVAATADFQAFSDLTDVAPNIQPNSSVLVSVANVENPFSSPTSIIYAVTPSVAFGTIIADKPPQLLWNKLIKGAYNQLRVTLLGTDLRPLTIQDGAMTIILAIGEEVEAIGVFIPPK